MNRGFAHYDDWLPKLPDGSDPLTVPDVKLRGLAIKRANVVADRAIDWIGKADPARPWFLFVHFFDAHWPYEPPELIGSPANGYEGELTFADYHCGRILAAIESRGLRERTLIVLQGDHGEDLAGWYANDKSGKGGVHPEEEGHGCCLYQQTQHVPLCFSHLGLPVSILHTPVTLADVAPTICGIVGLDFHGTDGVDLSHNVTAASEPDARVLYAETMYPRELVENTGKFLEIRNQQAIWLSASEKIIRKLGSPEEYVRFDLKSDPNEVTPQAVAPDNKDLLHFPPGEV
jgi:arylsulfatase A-like enzyme